MKPKQCGNCELWDRRYGARIDTSFTHPQQDKSKCVNAKSKQFGQWVLSINNGQDCPVYVERQDAK